VYFNIDHPDDQTQEVSDLPRYDVGDSVEAKWDKDGEFYPAKIMEFTGSRFRVQWDEGGTEDWTDEVQDLSEESEKELFFQMKNKKVESKPNWVSVTQLFREGVGSILRKLKIGADHPNFDRYNERLNQLYNRKESYLYPIQIVRGKSYREVTKIFTRVNTAGTRLRSSDLALAQITSEWPGSMKLFEGFVDECLKKDFYLDENFLVRCLISVTTGQSKFDYIQRVPLEKIKSGWELTKKAVQNTITFLKNNALIDSSGPLPSPILLIPLVAYSSHNNLCESDESERGFLYWFYHAAIWGRYSGSMETVLDQDLRALKDKKPWMGLIDNIWQIVGKDRMLTKDDFRGKSISSPLFFMTYVLARKNGARDMETGNVINYSNFGKNNEIEHDHIFPRSKLDKFFKDKLDNSPRRKLINELANMAFMTKSGNLIKTNDDPRDYFPRVHKKYNGDEYFKRQSIPYDLKLMDYEAYESFLDQRCILLAKHVNEFLTSLKKGGVSTSKVAD
jgi:hypothetical protein